MHHLIFCIHRCKWNVRKKDFPGCINLSTKITKKPLPGKAYSAFMSRIPAGRQRVIMTGFLQPGSASQKWKADIPAGIH
jgi:hypothetical protein